MTRREFIFLWLGLAILSCLGRSQSVGDTPSQKRSEGSGLEQNKVVVRRWIEEGFNKKDVKVLDELFAEDFLVNGRKVERVGLKQSMSQRFTAFPDLYVTITELLAEGDKVLIWYTANGTQRGEFEGIRPTGKPVSWIGADLLRIENGKIVEAHFLDDSLGLMRQLEATPSPAPIQK
jgi:steroid delta-isomerase-like uncharacterized protein